MAVTGRNAIALVLLIAASTSLRTAVAADRPLDVVASVAKALTAGDPSDAMTPFDKSCPNYEKLTRYFSELASAFQVQSEIDPTDEQNTGKQTKLTVNWILTLADLQNNSTERRSGEINVTLEQKSGKWKIINFAPIDLFNPQRAK